jgi:hypothetical protein
MRHTVSRLLACALLVLFGCSLVVDTSDLDAPCPAGFKLCGESGCVAEIDPAFGCGPSHCDPCPFMHGIPACDGSECTTRGCLDGFGCDKCKNNLFTDELNCGTCGHQCGFGKICSLGECVPLATLP